MTTPSMRHTPQPKAEIEALRRLIEGSAISAADRTRIEAALRPIEHRLRLAFDNTLTGTFLRDEDMTLVMVNTGFERITGYAAPEVEGRLRWRDLVEDGGCQRLATIRSTKASSQPERQEFECRLKTRGGKIREIYMVLEPIDGTRMSIGSFVDVGPIKKVRMKMEETRALSRAIVDGFDGLIYVSTRDYVLRFMNEALIDQVGRDACGEKCYEALHGRRSICPFCVMDQVQEGQTVRFEVKNPRDARWYHSMNSPIHHVGGGISLMALIRDVNDRKMAEKALRENEISLRKENTLLRSRIKERRKFGDIVGKSPPMQQVYEQILTAAASDANVIIYGEPGTGKELVAHAIHDISERRERRIVPVHCGAIPEKLFESEFFGYMAGAFSGADSDREGYIDYADGGTLFLDEVGEIDPHMQVKLLRVIEGGGYTPVGGNQVKRADIRIIAATNRDLNALVSEGRMREDFFYRLHILPIYLPPLRARKEDLPLLADHFIRIYGGKANIAPITGRMLERLMQHEWTGNVRELQNVIIRYCAQRTLELTDRPPSAAARNPALPPLPPPDDITDLRTMLAQYEKQVIEASLKQYRWSRSQAAHALGIDRKTLFNKMRRHGLMDAE